MKRARKGSGCVYRTKFRTKEGEEKLGGWRIKYAWNHQTYNESVAARNKGEAQEFLKQRFAEIASGTFVKGSEAESLRYEDMRGYLFRKYQQKGHRLSTAKDGKTKYINHLKHVDEFFGGRLALSIDARLLDEFVAERQAAGAADGTISRELGLLGSMFHLAVEEKKLRADHLPKIPKFKEAKPRRGFLECEDFPRLRRELPEHLRTILTLAFYTGMRKGEVLSLRWENVDLIEGVLLLEDTKNGEPRNVRLNDELLEMLKNERLHHPRCEWVFSRDGRTRIQSLRKTWKAACVRAGLGRFICRACGDELGAKSFCAACEKRCASPRYVGRIFHDLRRTGVRNLVRSGAPALRCHDGCDEQLGGENSRRRRAHDLARHHGD